MEAFDIEAKFLYEIQRTISPFIGPHGDSSGIPKPKCPEARKTWDDLASVNFLKFDGPRLICSCIEMERKEQATSTHVHFEAKKNVQCGCSKENVTNSGYLRSILDTIRPPQMWTTSKGVWKKQISCEPIKRSDILVINEQLNVALSKFLAQGRGVCPVRRHFFSSLFEEMIRQEMIISPDRGLLLMRVRDELKMSLMAFEALYAQGLNYGMQKRLTGEISLGKLKKEIDRLTKEIDDLKVQSKTLNEAFQAYKTGVETDSKASKMRAALDLQQLKDINDGLQTQLNQALLVIDKIEKARRLRQLQ